ncbi:hypothetical protein PAMP_024237 [Pampus punctatissimus]
MLHRAGKEFLVRMRFYVRPLFQGRYLMVTNTVSGGFTLALGDVVAQTRDIYKDPTRARDWRRTGNMFIVGCSMGPIMHVWYNMLDKILVGKAMSTVVMKMLLDQILASPALGLWYFLGMGLVEGHTLSYAWVDFKRKFVELLAVDWCVWPVAQMINFYFLSPKYRVVYINTVTLGWDAYLSYLKHRDDSQATELVSENSTVNVQEKTLLQSKPLEEKA